MFASKLKYLRESKGLTQYQLAENLGFSKSTISNYESGLREPKDNAIWIKISKYFNVSVDYLMGIENNELVNDFTYAMLDETKDLSEDQQAAILAMVKTYKNQLGK